MWKKSQKHNTMEPHTHNLEHLINLFDPWEEQKILLIKQPNSSYCFVMVGLMEGQPVSIQRMANVCICFQNEFAFHEAHHFSHMLDQNSFVVKSLYSSN